FLLVQGFSKNSCKNLALGYKSRFSAVFFDYFTIPRVYALFSKPYINAKWTELPCRSFRSFAI
ncbi:hypothetical protein ABE419_12845, partial [Brevibacillus agri]|uniref:hypothetical protein n=1 Tax=Brevibacillus agri TaxID=51101 RepID=UPI003D259253